MNRSEARDSIKSLAEESSSLEPSALLSFFEIDLTELLESKQRVVNSNIPMTDGLGNTVLRFHNNVKLIKSSLYFGYQTLPNGTSLPIEYFAAPIQADGFEISAKGTPPNPKLSVSINFDGLPTETANRVRYLKQAMRDLDDMVGATVRRVRTFAKYINCNNFYTDCSASTPSQLISNQVLPPEDWEEDVNAYFPVDTFYIDRKSSENKNHIELELASPFDSQDLKLPGRTVTVKACPWIYRGEGCCYEYNAVKTADQAEHTAASSIFHNVENECKSISSAAPFYGTAPPVGTYKDENIVNELIKDGYAYQAPKDSNNNYLVPEIWDRETLYAPGVPVRIRIKGINYYFVSKKTLNKGYPPPDDGWWWADQCSKSLDGCRLRWTHNLIHGPTSTPLPFGGFPTSRRSVK